MLTNIYLVHQNKSQIFDFYYLKLLKFKIKQYKYYKLT